MREANAAVTARGAYAAASETLELTDLVADRPELLKPLQGAWLAGYRRVLKQPRKLAREITEFFSGLG